MVALPRRDRARSCRALSVDGAHALSLFETTIHFLPVHVGARRVDLLLDEPAHELLDAAVDLAVDERARHVEGHPRGELAQQIAAGFAFGFVPGLVLEVGALSSVLPEALSFCFDLATEGTVVEGAALEVRTAAATARCRSCDANLSLARASDRCPCGAYDLEWLSGDALTILELEVA